MRRMRLHAIAWWQSGVESRTTRRIEFDLLPLPPPTNASSRPSRCLPLQPNFHRNIPSYHQLHRHTVRHRIVIPSVSRRHTSSYLVTSYRHVVVSSLLPCHVRRRTKRWQRKLPKWAWWSGKTVTGKNCSRRNYGM